MKLVSKFLEFLFPDQNLCVVCGRPRAPLCASCYERVLSLQTHRVRLVAGVGRVMALLPYEGEMRRRIHNMKFGSQPHWARLFARALRHSKLLESSPVDVVTAVPMHRSRYIQRGYNQADLLAQELAREQGIPYRELLVRVKNTLPQHTLSRLARQTSQDGAFHVAADPKDLRVLLVDDVLTTGNTVRACKEALEVAGAREVVVVVLAMALPRSNKY